MGDLLDAMREHVALATSTHPRDVGELALSAALIAVAVVAWGATLTRARRDAAEQAPEPTACSAVAGKSGRVRVEGVVEPGPRGPIIDDASGDPYVWYEGASTGDDASAAGSASRGSADPASREEPAPAFVVRDLTGSTLIAPSSVALTPDRHGAIVLRPGERVSLVGRVEHRVGLGPVLVGDPVRVRRLPPDDFGRRRPPPAPVGVRIGLILTVCAGIAGVFVLGLTFRQ
jgi:hypothetical protein